MSLINLTQRLRQLSEQLTQAQTEEEKEILQEQIWEIEDEIEALEEEEIRTRYDFDG